MSRVSRRTFAKGLGAAALAPLAAPALAQGFLGNQII